jgi:hypothetical protein
LLAGDTVAKTEKIVVSDDSALASEQARVEIVTNEEGVPQAYTIKGGKPPTVTWENVEAGVNTAANSTADTPKGSWRDRLNKAPAEVAA